MLNPQEIFPFLLKCMKTEIPSARCLNQGDSSKTAATYSPTVTQYHRRDEA